MLCILYINLYQMVFTFLNKVHQTRHIILIKLCVPIKEISMLDTAVFSRRH